MYSQQQFDEMEEFALAEVHRTDLCNLALQIKALGLGNPRVFPFVEAPQGPSLDQAMLTLKQAQVVADDEPESLLPLGRVLALLPVDIPIGKILVLGCLFDTLQPIATIAAAVTVQSPFLRLPAGDQRTALRRELFYSEHGDPFMVMNCFNAWTVEKADRRSAGSSRKWCQRHGLAEQRLYEMAKLRRQFIQLLVDVKLVSGEESADVDEDGENRYERRGRGEKRRRLHELRQQQGVARKRRTLRMDDSDGEGAGREGSGDELGGDQELRHLDLELSVDITKLRDSANSEMTVHDIHTIKVVLCAGLYPRIALADPGNANRPENERVFHTQFKSFVRMHPSSMFTTEDVFVASSEVLVFEKLLETHKAFLTNCLRSPALQTLLLFARTIDSNDKCTKLVVDNWIVLQLESRLSHKVLAMVTLLRRMLGSMLEQSLSKIGQPAGAIEIVTPPNLSTMPSWGMDQALPPALYAIREEFHRPMPGCTKSLLAQKLAEFLAVRCESLRASPTSAASRYRLPRAHPFTG